MDLKTLITGLISLLSDGDSTNVDIKAVISRVPLSSNDDSMLDINISVRVDNLLTTRRVCVKVSDGDEIAWNAIDASTTNAVAEHVDVVSEKINLSPSPPVLATPPDVLS